MRKEDKKGVSAVITTLLIILLSLAAIAVVWVVIQSIVSKGSEGVSLDRFAFNLVIRSAYIDGQDVKISVHRNSGGGDLQGIYFIFHNGTDSISVQENFALAALNDKLFSFSFAAYPGLSTSNLVSIAPVYVASGEDTIGDITDTADIRSTPPPGAGSGGTGSVCGNSVLETGEQCDDGNTNNDDGCTSQCQLESASFCDGDGIIDSGEYCDGSNLNGQTCITLGFDGGTLACSSCAFDTSQCTSNQPICGNGVIETGEQCDGSNLNGQACVDLGFAGGTLACNSNTCQFDTSQCTSGGSGGFCGDGFCNASSGETSVSCPQDCPAPASCNGTWTQEDINDGNDCDGGANCVSCTCLTGYEPDGVGGCVPEPSVNNGTVDSVWPAGAVKYFDSNDLPKSGVTMASYVGKYVNFSGAGGETGCFTVSYAEYISDPAYDKSYIRISLIASILPGDSYAIWNSSTCGV